MVIVGWVSKTSIIANRSFNIITFYKGKLSSSNIRLPEMQFLEVPLVPWETCLSVYGSTGALDSPKSVGKKIRIVFDVDLLSNLLISFLDGKWMM